MIKPLATKRLILRDFVPPDWAAVCAFLSDPDVTHFMHFANYNEADLRDWFDWCLENSQSERQTAYNWAIVLKANEANRHQYAISRGEFEAIKPFGVCPGFVLILNRI
jgi:RimJ/RimL family protein N-acetyltransferase